MLSIRIFWWNTISYESVKGNVRFSLNKRKCVIQKERQENYPDIATCCFFFGAFIFFLHSHLLNLAFVNPFQGSVPFLYPLKVFLRFEKDVTAWNGFSQISFWVWRSAEFFDVHCYLATVFQIFFISVYLVRFISST